MDFIRVHAGEGRLTTEELEDRVGAALSAKTLGDLDDLVVDLPAERTEPLLPPAVPNRRSFLAGSAVRYALLAIFLLGLAAPGPGRGAFLGFFIVAMVVLRFARRLDRRRRWDAGAQARAAQLPPPPVESTSWEPPRAEGRY